MVYEWDVWNVLNCSGDVSLEYFNVYLQIDAFGDTSPKIKNI